MDGQETTITIKSVEGDAWLKPGSTQKWWTVLTEERPGEVTKYIQDTSKGVEAPKEGKFTGKMWDNKFYPKLANTQSSFGGQRSSNNAARAKQDAEKQSDIKAEWAIGKALASLGGTDLEEVEKMAKLLFEMVDRVKGSSESTNPKGATPPTPNTDTTMTNGSGASKPQARDWNKVGQSRDDPAPVEDGDYESLVKSGYAADDINLADIPI